MSSFLWECHRLLRRIPWHELVVPSPCITHVLGHCRFSVTREIVCYGSLLFLYMLVISMVFLPFGAHELDPNDACVLMLGR